jgi:hypothetical protein
MMLRRLIIFCLLCSLAPSANADPILLLLLRMVRDHAISTSVQGGIDSVRNEPSTPVVQGYAFSPPSSTPTNARDLRTLIDDNFKYLSSEQRDAVYVSMRQLVDDPKYAQDRPQIMAEFALKARQVGASYQSLEKLTDADRRTLLAQAREGYKSLPSAERGELIDALKNRILPIPRDLNDTMLAELSSIPASAFSDRGSD